MSKDPPKKSTKGRKAMQEKAKKTTIRASIPSSQADAARAAASRKGLEWNQFVQAALKEAIYQEALENANGASDSASKSEDVPLASLPPARQKQRMGAS